MMSHPLRIRKARSLGLGAILAAVLPVLAAHGQTSKPATPVVAKPAAAKPAAEAPDAETPMPETGGPPVMMVVGLDGTPQMTAPGGGAAKPLVADTTIEPGTTIITDENSRAAISIAWAPSTNPSHSDLFVIGPKSRVTLATGATTASRKGAPVPPIAVVVHEGIYHAVTRHLSGLPAFTIRTGDRELTLDYTDLLGSYVPEGDVALQMVMAGTLSMHAGKRNVAIRPGLARIVEGGRIQGARRIPSDQRERVVALTRVVGVDVSQPAAFLAHEGMVAKPSTEITDPRPWQYDKTGDRYFDPNHGHWHNGKPPADQVAAWKKAHEEEGGDTPIVAHKDAPATGRNVGDLTSNNPFGAAASASAEEDLRYARVTTNKGEIIFELNHAKAPISVDNFVSYAQKGFYDGTIFHRVMDGFMIQGGGFTVDMERKETGPPIVNEWKNGLKNLRGTVAMARLGRLPDSATSQFFINVADNGFLDSPRDGAAYAVFGRVVKGMDVVDAIKGVRTEAKAGHGNVPVEPVIIESIQIISKDEAGTG